MKYNEALNYHLIRRDKVNEEINHTKAIAVMCAMLLSLIYPQYSFASAEDAWLKEAASSVVRVSGCHSIDKRCNHATGFFVDSNDIIFTTYERFVDSKNHRLADQFSVRLANGEQRTARMLVVDPLLNLGVLILKPDTNALFSPQPLTPARGVAVSPHDHIVALVASDDVAITGTVKEKNRTTLYNKGMGDLFINIQLEMPSIGLGGPLFTADGQLIGINTAAIPAALADVVTHDEEHALPMSVIMSYYQALVRYPTFDMPWFGVAYRNLRIKERQVIRAAGVSQGLMIDYVWPEGIGSKYGLHSGDVILEVNDQTVNHQYKLDKYLFDLGADKKVELKVLRGTEVISLPVTTERRPAWAAL